MGLLVPDEEQQAQDATYQASLEAQKQGRAARCRLRVVAAYHYSCALTRYRLTTLTGKSIVLAPHFESLLPTSSKCG
jgi:putative restriction endonuclease